MTDEADETILIRAIVKHRHENALDVVLEDGFGRPSLLIHSDAALPDLAP